jgi:hypothetical protein
MGGESILFSDGAKDSARVSNSQAVGRDISRYNGACADYTAFANGYACANGYAATKPTVIPDGNRACPFQVGNHSRFGI